MIVLAYREGPSAFTVYAVLPCEIGRRLVQFPIGALVSSDHVAALCVLLGAIRERAADIRKAA